MEEFLEKLGNRESSGKYTEENDLGYLGKYQFGKLALQDAGYRDKKTGKWTGKDGVNSKQDFLNNKDAQENAIRTYTKIQRKYLKNYGADKHIGTEFKGVPVTESGLLAAAHLIGAKGLSDALNTGVDKKDGYGTPATEYLKLFKGIDLDDKKDNKMDKLKKLEELREGISAPIKKEEVIDPATALGFEDGGYKDILSEMGLPAAEDRSQYFTPDNVDLSQFETEQEPAKTEGKSVGEQKPTVEKQKYVPSPMDKSEEYEAYKEGLADAKPEEKEEEKGFFQGVKDFFTSGDENQFKRTIARPDTGNPQLNALLQEYDASMEQYKEDLDSAKTKDMWTTLAQGLMDYAAYQNAAVGARAGLGIKPMKVDLGGNYADQVRKQRPDIKGTINEASLYKEGITPYQKELLKRKDRELEIKDKNKGKVSTKLSDREKIDYKIAAEEAAKVREQKRKDEEVAKKAIMGVDDIIDNIDRAIKLSEKSKKSTLSKSGPVAGRTPTFTDLGQELEEAYSQISFNNFVEKAKGMSKAFDSEKEREFYEKTQPSILKDEDVNIKNLKRLKKRMLKRKSDFSKDLGESNLPKKTDITEDDIDKMSIEELKEAGL